MIKLSGFYCTWILKWGLVARLAGGATRGRFHQHFCQANIRRRTAFGKKFAHKIRRFLWRMAFGERRTNLLNFSLQIWHLIMLMKLIGKFFAGCRAPESLRLAHKVW